MIQWIKKLVGQERGENNEMKYLIVGLGNVGAEYANTRHNAGFMVIDQLVKEAQESYVIERHAYRSELRWRGRTVVIIRPTTLMNLSGKAVHYWIQKEKISRENLLVVVDDLALPVGKIRMKKQGSNGGHNGLADIDEKLGSTDYARLRIGIGDNFSRGKQIEYVLGQFTSEERTLLDPAIEKAAEAVKSFVTQGVERTMNQYN